MAWNPAYLEVRLSGGASNTTVANSLGGAMSTVSGGRAYGKTASALTNVTGVTVLDAPGSFNGNGTLSFVASGTTATWTPLGGTAGTAVNIGTNGRYALKGTNSDASDAYLMVEVVAASLPGTNKTDTVLIADALNKTFDDVAKGESFAGMTDYRCLYVKNAHSTDALLACKIYIGSNTSGVDDIYIGAGTAAIGDGSASPEQTVANKTTAPSGVTFGQPANASAGYDLGAIGAGQCVAMWIKRVVPSTMVADTADLSSIVLYPVY